MRLFPVLRPDSVTRRAFVLAAILAASACRDHRAVASDSAAGNVTASSSTASASPAGPVGGTAAPVGPATGSGAPVATTAAPGAAAAPLVSGGTVPPGAIAPPPAAGLATTTPGTTPSAAGPTGAVLPGAPSVAPPATAASSLVPATSAPAVATPAAAAPTPAAPRLAFASGERFDYQVKFGFLGVGEASLAVLGGEEIRGVPTVHTTFTVNGGVRFFKVDDHYETWFDPRTFSVLRFTQHIDEGSYERERRYEVYPDRHVYVENGTKEEPTVAEPLDEAAFIYFLRTVPLEVGKTYDFNRYFKPDRNPVRVTVLRRERVTVPAGTFDAIVVQPTIKTTGIFGEGGHAQVWFTDDSSRTLVQLKSQLKFGSINLYLKSLRPGTR